jgi:hypothetical protein
MILPKAPARGAILSHFGATIAGKPAPRRRSSSNMPNPRAMNSAASTMKMPTTMKIMPSPVKNTDDVTETPITTMGNRGSRNPSSRGTPRQRRA